jgi:hypothetical protein
VKLRALFRRLRRHPTLWDLALRTPGFKEGMRRAADQFESGDTYTLDEVFEIQRDPRPDELAYPPEERRTAGTSSIG